MKLTFLSALFLTTLAAEPLQFIPATPENSTMADGSPLPEELSSSSWQWLKKQGEPNGIESIPHAKQSHSIMMVMASGLEPNAVYEVYGVFHQNANAKQPMRNRAVLPAGFGLTMASIHYFDGKASQEAPWLITPDTEIGKAYGIVTLPASSGMPKGFTDLGIQGDDKNLAFAQLGTARAAADGSIPVFISAFPHVGGNGRTVVDGLVIHPAKDNAGLPHVLNPATILHLAIRAGDNVTFDRALDMKVDVNSLDEEGLTPLFYASATGDTSLVRKLLDRGADPNATGQSVPPLTAAATVPCLETTTMLLDAGAIVRPSAYETHGKLHLGIDPRFIHPLVAAIQAGSLPVAKKLADKVPELDIESLYPDIEIRDENLSVANWNAPTTVAPMKYLIAAAVSRGQWELAEWLLGKGCKPITPHLGDWYDGRKIMRYQSALLPHAPIMVWATAGGDKSLPFLDAMIRKGYRPVIQRNHGHDFSGIDYSILPWDVLSTACFMGNKAMVARFLPEATELDRISQERLISLAIFSGNDDVIRLLREQFPNASPPRYRPDQESRIEADSTHEDETLRLLLPRTTQRPARENQDGGTNIVMAVIASPDAAGPGAALSAYASNSEVWTVVDRDVIESALGEKSIAKPWIDGTHRFSELGDRLAADVLVIASKLPGDAFSLYRFEAVEVATGLEIHREHFKDDKMDIETDLSRFLLNTAAAMDRARMHERRQAVTMVAFTANKELPNSTALARTLGAAVRARIDETPAFISLSRSQSGRLMEEQALKGAESLWAAAHLLEAAVRPAEDGRITVAMRLETLRNGERVKQDEEVTGYPSDLADLAAAAWNKLVGSTNESGVAQDAAAMAKNAELEFTRLLREIEWMMQQKTDPSEILPMIESAAALGAPADQIAPLHLDCLYRRISDFTKWDRSGSVLQHCGERAIVPLPLSPYYSDKIVHSLPAARELLHQTHFYILRDQSLPGERNRGNPRNPTLAVTAEYWNALQFLSFLRAAIYPNMLIDEEAQSEFGSFARDLDDCTRAYFDFISKNPPLHTSYFVKNLDKHVLQRNPELTRGLVRVFRKTAFLRHNHNELAFSLVRHAEHTKWLDPMGYLSSTFLAENPRDASPTITLNRALAKYQTASLDERAATYREAMLHTFETPATAHQEAQGLLYPAIRAHSLGYYLDHFATQQLIHHGNKVIPHLVQTGRPAPDLLMRPSTYMTLCRLYSLPTSLTLGQKNIDILRNNYAKEIDRLAAGYLRTGNPEVISSLHDAAIAFESILGEPIAASFGKKHAEYLKFKSNNLDMALEAELILDTRSADSSQHAFTCQFEPDLTDPNLIWLNHHPYRGGLLPVDSSGDRLEGVQRLRPWILGINLNNNRIEKAFNLGSIAGVSGDLTSPGWTREPWLNSYTQSNGKLLANVEWGDRSKLPNTLFTALIDKVSGKMRTLPEHMTVTNTNGFMALECDGSFYTLHHLNRLRVVGDGKYKFSFNRLDSDGAIEPISEYARRPEKTPFDAEDRIPWHIMRYGEKILVTDQWADHAALYDPANQSWELQPTETAQQINHFRNLRSTADVPSAPIRNGRGWSMDYANSIPGAIAFSHRAHGTKQVRIQIDIPENFAQGVQYASSSGVTDRSTAQVKAASHAEYIGTKPLHPIVISQTSDHLILAMHFDGQYRQEIGIRGNRFLPFLWRVAKEDVLSELE